MAISEWRGQKSPRLLNREQVPRLFSFEASSYQELVNLASLSLGWCGLGWKEIRFLQVHDLLLDLGLVSYQGGFIEIQPESKPPLLKYLKERKFKRGEYVLLTTKKGEQPSRGYFGGWKQVGLATFGCPISHRDLNASLVANIIKENPGLGPTEIMKLCRLKSWDYYYNSLANLSRLGREPCDPNYWII